jgi:hypothetical protein
LSESLPFFTNGDFSILHFFASFLTSPPSLLLFETYSVFESGLNAPLRILTFQRNIVVLSLILSLLFNQSS